MRTTRRHLLDLLGSLGAGTFVLLWFYGPVLVTVNQRLFSGVSDGIKNYFVLFFPILHEDSWFQTRAMGYPFGEHLLYLDAQPILVWTLKCIDSLVSVQAWMLGFVNASMLVSVVLSAAALAAIFRLLGHRPLYSIPAGVAIAFLSPQLLRILGHYGLAYTLPIPLCWLGLIWFRLRGSTVSSLFIALNSLFWALIHTYLLGLLSFLVGGTWGLILLRKLQGSRASSETDPETKRAAGSSSFLRMAVDFSLQAILPVALFLAVAWLSDPYFGQRSRAATDFDPTIYRATLEGLFAPFMSPLGEGLPARMSRFGNLMEGMSYLGLVVPALLLFLLLHRIAGRIRQHRNPPRAIEASRPTLSFENRITTEGLIVGTVALILALGWLWMGDGWLWEWAGPFRHLRAIGRFSWILYYTASVFAFSRLFNLAGRATAGRKRAWQVVIVLALSIQLLEGRLQANEIRKILATASVQASFLIPAEKESESRPPHLPEKLQADRFQAILPLPYYHIGSDRDFRFVGSERSIPESMAISLKSGLPLLALHSARTPATLSRMSLSLLDRGSELEQLQSSFPDRRPFLVVVSGDRLAPEEEKLLQQAVPLESQQGIRFYELSFSKAFR